MDQQQLPLNISMFVQQMSNLMDAMSSVLRMYGLSLNLEKVDIEPADCDNCIDFVYRLRCDSEAVCSLLKAELEKMMQK